MEMKVLNSELRQCTCCMKKHDVKVVSVDETVTVKGKKVHYCATYTYCDVAGELYADETQLKENYKRLKKAYQ